jgi:small-conductance mechanosensitive channel
MPPWAVVCLILVVALLLAWGAHAALHALTCRFLKDRYEILYPIVMRTRNIVRFAVVVLSVSALLPFAPIPKTLNDDAHRVLLAAFIVLAGWIVIVAVNMALDHYSRGLRIDGTDNLMARRAVTQVRILKRAVDVLLVVITAGIALMSFESVRQFGISVFASAGIAGIAAGLAARPVLSNLVSGVQLALTQPIRYGDLLVVEGNFGEVEEIDSTYVVLKLWDLRRMVIPLTYFFEKPFENWTRTSAAMLGTVFLYVDYQTPVEAVRDKLDELVRHSPHWDGQVAGLVVTDAREQTMELRATVSAADSGKLWNLRCEIREKLLAYIRDEFPEALPRRRTEAVAADQNLH